MTLGGFLKSLCTSGLLISKMEVTIVPTSLGCLEIKWVNTSASNSSDTLPTLKAWTILSGLVHIIFYVKFSLNFLKIHGHWLFCLMRAEKLPMALKTPPTNVGVPIFWFLLFNSLVISQLVQIRTRGKIKELIDKVAWSKK